MTEQEQVDQLYSLVYLHKHREEIMQLMKEQLDEDTSVLEHTIFDR